METVVEPDAMIGRRLYPRAEILAKVDCRVGGRSDEALVCDVSSNGCLMQCRPGLAEPGDDIQIRFRHGVMIAGRVVWRQRLNIGVQFSGHVPRFLIAAPAVPKLTATSAGREREVLQPAHAAANIAWM